MKKIILIFMLILCLGMVYASPTLFLKEGDVGQLKIPCIHNGMPCNSTATCNITVVYPNGTNMVTNQQMTNSGAYHNYTLPDTSVVGEYKSFVYCADSTEYGDKAFSFRINAYGEDGTGISSIIYFLMAVLAFAIVLTIISYAFGNTWLSEVFLAMSFVCMTVLAYLGYQSSKDWGSALSKVMFGVYILFLAFTLLVVLLILLNWTLAVVGWIMGKQDKVEDKLI